MNKDSISNCYPPDFTYHPRIQLDEKIASIEKGKVQVLHGTIGTGKSSAALHFIDHSKEKFTVRWRVNCSEDEESIKSSLTELANKLGVETDTSFSRLFQAIREKAAKEDIIFLLDEVQKKPCGLWRKELWRIKDSLYIMATTNNANLDLDSPCEHWIHVDKFDEAVQFLKAEEQILENKDEDLNELCEYFSWNVLGLTAAKIYITKMKISVKNYLRMQRKKTAAMKVLEAEQDRTLYTAVRTCLDGIDEKDFPVAAAISLIAHENIAECLLSELFSENDAPTRSACLNNLLQRSFLVKSLVHITTENDVRFLSFHKFTQSVIRHILDEDQSLRKNLIHKMAGVLVRYFRKDNRYKKDDFMQRIMVNHVEEFLKQCQDDQDDRISIASARLSEVIAYTYTQGQEKLSEDSLRFHFQRSEDILHRLCGVTLDDFRVNSICQETGNDLQSLGIRCSDIAVAQRLFEKLTKKSSELSNAIVQELALSRPLRSVDLSSFRVEMRNDEELMEKVNLFESLSDEDLELLIRKGLAYPADDYRKFFLAELYSSIVYSFGRNYFYLNKKSIKDANLYINRLKLAYCISREISKRMKSGEAVLHEYLSQCHGLLKLLTSGEDMDENGCIKPKETKVHCQDLTNAIKHYEILSQDKRQFFEMGVLKKKKDETYSLLVCHYHIVDCYLQLISPEMTSSSEERDQYIRDGVKHRDTLLDLLNTEISKDGNEQLTYLQQYFEFIQRFDRATKCTEEEKDRSTSDKPDAESSGNTPTSSTENTSSDSNNAGGSDEQTRLLNNGEHSSATETSLATSSGINVISTRKRTGPSLGNDGEIHDSSSQPESKKAPIAQGLGDEVYFQLCQKLESQMNKNDFKSFGKKMGYSIKQVNHFKQKKYPADALLSDWQNKNGNDLEKLMSIYEEMGQHDVVAMLQNAIDDESQGFERLKIAELNSTVYRELCSGLNEKILSKDYEALAGAMGYISGEVETFKRTPDPADALLSDWGTKDGNDVPRLIEYLRDKGRDDLVKFLEESCKKAALSKFGFYQLPDEQSNAEKDSEAAAKSGYSEDRLKNIHTFEEGVISYFKEKVQKYEERIPNPMEGMAQSVLECIVEKTAKELSRIFEFQLSMLKGSDSVQKMAIAAVDLMADIKGEKFNENTLLKKVLDSNGSKTVTKQMLEVKPSDVKDVTKKWHVPCIFWKTGLRKSHRGKKYLGSFSYWERRGGSAKKYGFRDQSFEVNENETQSNDVHYLDCDADEKFDIPLVSSNGNSTSKQIPRTFFNYEPYHCLLRSYTDLKDFSAVKSTVPTLAGFVRKMYNYPENQPVKPVFRSWDRRIEGEELDLHEASLKDSDLTGANFRNYILERCDFRECVVLSGNFEGASMEGAFFQGAYLSDCILDGAKAQDCCWSDAQLRHCQVSRTDFRNPRSPLDYNSCPGTDFSTAILKDEEQERKE